MTVTVSRKGTSAKPFSLEHFEWWARRLVLDNGSPWELEDFQLEFLADLFGGARENWLIVPEGNAKTTLVAGVGLYGLRFAPDALIPVAASSRDQARIMYRQAKGFLRRSKLDDPGFEFLAFDGYRRIDLRGPGRTKRGEVLGSMEMHAADAGTGDGIIPFPFALLDELHRHRDMSLYETWRGKLDKRGSQLVGISTAGEADSVFEETRARVRRATPVVESRPGFVRCRSREISFHEYQLEAGGDPADMVAVKRCNPLPSITVESLSSKRASPTMSEQHWQRFVCNVAVRSAQAWIPAQAWDAAREDGASIPFGETVTVGVDVGLVHDATGVVCAWRRPDGRALIEARVWTPSGGGKIRLDDIEDYLRELSFRFDVVDVLYDPRFFERSAQTLSDEGLSMVELTQNSSSMADAYQGFYSAVAEGQIVHSGDPVLTAHVLGTAAEMTDRGWKVRKMRQSQRIDACVAAVMAVYGLESPTSVTPEPWVAAW